MYEIRNYITPAGRDVYAEWRDRLRDVKGLAAILRRVNRMEQGNFGDHKYLRDGVSELRLDVGPGYRLYYALDGERIILLICGGDKGTQRADIDRACGYWHDWQERIKRKDGKNESS